MECVLIAESICSIVGKLCINYQSYIFDTYHAAYQRCYDGRDKLSHPVTTFRPEPDWLL